MERKEMKLSPEELFYLGTLLQAKYIDYDYVAAMGDIQQRYAVFESEAKENLSQKGILEEDFSGNLNVEGISQNVLQPVFFGENESSIELIVNTEDGRMGLNRKYHFYEGNITEVDMDEELTLRQTDLTELQEWIGAVFSADIQSERKEISIEELDPNQLGLTVIIKSIQLPQKATVDVYMEFDGSVFREDADGKAVSLSYRELCQEIYQKMKGV